MSAKENVLGGPDRYTLIFSISLFFLFFLKNNTKLLIFVDCNCEHFWRFLQGFIRAD